MPILFERNICRNFAETTAREWLLTNGLGGYATGTLAGTLTRMQHGLLVAALPEEVVPQLLLAKIDEEVLFDQRTYYLGTNEYRDGTLNPAGFVHLESFRLEEGLPIFTYRLGGIDGVTLEKRIWMLQGQNTTCIQYRALRTSTPQTDASNIAWRGNRPGAHSYSRLRSLGSAQPALTLSLLPFVAHRPYDQPQYGGADGQFEIHIHDSAPQSEAYSALPQGMAGCTIHARGKARPFHILASGDPASTPQFLSTGVWYWHFLRRHDQASGLADSDDLYLPGVIRARLVADQALTVIVTAEELRPHHFEPHRVSQLYAQELDYQRGLLATRSYFGEGGGTIQSLPVLPLTASSEPTVGAEEFLQLLHQAGDRFLIRRTVPHQEQAGVSTFFFNIDEHIPTITPGYFQLKDHTREALIALPGLTITTRRYSEAQRALRYLARHFRQGLLPDHLPTTRQPTLEDEDYASVDTPLWYCYALDKYLSATHDYELLDELYPRLEESLACYIQGTAYGIQLDPGDGLLRTCAPERALTWMNALDQGRPVTPRTGKAVEVNALWYHTLSLMQEWAHILYKRGRINYLPHQYKELCELCWLNFNTRFWYQEGAYLYDVIDTSSGHERCLRPNQLFAISLRHAILDASKQSAVLEAITRDLLTPYGLHSLAPGDPAYRGELPVKHAELPRVLHQGGIWPWLIGPYIDTLLKVYLQQASAPGASSELYLYKEYIWRKGLQILEPFRQQMQEHMLGSIGSVYTGNAPHTSMAQLASAMSIGEILRTYKVLAHMGVQQSGNQAISLEIS